METDVVTGLAEGVSGDSLVVITVDCGGEIERGLCCGRRLVPVELFTTGSVNTGFL